ncbi:MAG: carotenoid biosynthesis protein [Limisphaerales bacterium]
MKTIQKPAFSPTNSSARKNRQPDDAEKNTLRIHLILTILLAAVFALEITTFFAPLNLSDWLEALLILLATISTLAALARQLPLQNVLLAAFVIAVVGGGISALGARTGVPFGPLTFGSEAGQKIFKTLPLVIPLIWVVVILNSRGTARLILRPWRKTRTYGFWLMGFTALLVLLFDLALEPFASHVKHYWLWMPTKFPLTWQGAPLVNFLSWAVVTLLILAFVTPTLINKQLSKKGAPHYHPFGIWLGAILLFGIAAATRELWLAVIVDGIIAVVVAIFAIRGGRW